MVVEETDNHRALIEAYSDEEVLAIEHAIVGSLSPEESFAGLRWMIPHINASERAFLLGGMRRGAPPEVFKLVMELACEALSQRDFYKLEKALAHEARASQRLRRMASPGGPTLRRQEGRLRQVRGSALACGARDSFTGFQQLEGPRDAKRKRPRPMLSIAISGQRSASRRLSKIKRASRLLERSGSRSAGSRRNSLFVNSLRPSFA